MHGPRRRGWLAAWAVVSRGAVLSVPLLVAGCMTPDLRCPDDPVAMADPEPVPGFQPFDRVPRARLGAVPCPGGYTLFKITDPTRLGEHTYANDTLAGRSEKARGIVYTRHGGFIDIAHVRKVADWTAYHRPRFSHALGRGWGCVVLSSKERSVYRIRLNYPSDWASMEPEARRRLIDALSIRLAQRLAITQTHWHEIATWFGYSATFLPEKASAFTYDDTTSHILGARVAGMAMRDTQRHYNDAMTWHLDAEMRRLGAVSQAMTRRAVRMVEGDWWRGGRVVRRQVDIGLDDGAVDPWIVPGFPDGRTAAGFAFEIPSLADVAGRDLSGCLHIEIDPKISAWGRMRRLLPGSPATCDPQVHFPLLIEHIRQVEAGR